eukprot:CAMPEP_0181199170 /NCGR_PEP_ID=MMETSP1096-20121128/17029_1 /TAXON_ID=156174 ORGANISM="Chrysochromulina ericina, Strain CCMP281" /NCGR_SAMPLE_ID=MMETSP1096 /ASSEMBLY_ACC=CAM_ASM_000453 /LENGTH=70 /DNA_ID=CAMNT_0023289325 /DNA_START=204 /DNA_END=416 /DNA_ORIENTATION=-
MKAPWYLPKKESAEEEPDQYWKPGDEPSPAGFFDAFMQGFNYEKKQKKEREEARAAREAVQQADPTEQQE